MLPFPLSLFLSLSFALSFLSSPAFLSFKLSSRPQLPNPFVIHRQIPEVDHPCIPPSVHTSIRTCTTRSDSDNECHIFHWHSIPFPCRRRRCPVRFGSRHLCFVATLLFSFFLSFLPSFFYSFIHSFFPGRPSTLCARRNCEPKFKFK
ncbi:hypothetical protein C8F01DRAFT_723528 [Mycena amicta]|nr:hypothetical protein C8F01DRAFT_723528 [Mycena amicta]